MHNLNNSVVSWYSRFIYQSISKVQADAERDSCKNSILSADTIILNVCFRDPVMQTVAF